MARVIPGLLVVDPVGTTATSRSSARIAEPIPAEPKSSERPAVGPFDREALLAVVAGDRAVLAQLIHLALDEDAPRLLAELETAAAAGDLAGLHSAAHGIKGLVGELKAEPCRAAAAALEAAASDGDAQSCPALTAELKARWAELSAALRALE